MGDDLQALRPQTQRCSLWQSRCYSTLLQERPPAPSSRAQPRRRRAHPDHQSCTVESAAVLLGNYQTTVVVFPAASIPDPTFQVAYQGTQRLECLGVPLDREDVTLQEQSYVVALKHDMKDTVDHLPSTNITGFGNTPFLPSEPSEPLAKRPRLSEPSLSARPPPNAPLAPAAARTRQSDGLPQPLPKPMRQSSFGPKFKTVRS